MPVEYVTMPNCPGQFFRCERLSAVLKVDSCADRWRRAHQAPGTDDDTSVTRCHNCPTGAMHAGEEHANASPLYGKPICSRCHRGSSRLVGDSICVSCYNRQREWILGRNAKGKPPVKQKPLRPAAIAYLEGGEVRAQRADHVESTTELVIKTLRQARKQVVFGFFRQGMA